MSIEGSSWTLRKSCLAIYKKMTFMYCNCNCNCGFRYLELVPVLKWSGTQRLSTHNVNDMHRSQQKQEENAHAFNCFCQHNSPSLWLRLGLRLGLRLCLSHCIRKMQMQMQLLMQLYMQLCHFSPGMLLSTLLSHHQRHNDHHQLSH